MRAGERGRQPRTGTRERPGPRRPEPTLSDRLGSLLARLRPLVDNDRSLYRQPRGSYIEENMTRNLEWRRQQRAELVRGLRRRFRG